MQNKKGSTSGSTKSSTKGSTKADAQTPAADARLSAILGSPEREVNASAEAMQAAQNSGLLTEATPAELSAAAQVTAQLALTDAGAEAPAEDMKPRDLYTAAECAQAQREAAEMIERAQTLTEQAAALTEKAAAEQDEEKREKITTQASAAQDEAAKLTAEAEDMQQHAAASLATYTPAVLTALDEHSKRAATARALSEVARGVSEAAELDKLHAAKEAARDNANKASAAQAKAEAERDGAHMEHRRDKAERPDMAQVSGEKYEAAQITAHNAKTATQDAEKAAEAAETAYSKAAAQVDSAQKRAEAAHNEAAAALDKVKDAYADQMRAEQADKAAALMLENIRAMIPNLSAAGEQFARSVTRPEVRSNGQRRTDALAGALYAATREILKIYQAAVPETRTARAELVIGLGRDADDLTAYAALDGLTERETVTDKKGKVKAAPAFGTDADGKAIKRADWTPERERVYAGLKVTTRHMDAGGLSKPYSNERGAYQQAKAALKAETDNAQAITAPSVTTRTIDAPATPAPFGAQAITPTADAPAQPVSE